MMNKQKDMFFFMMLKAYIMRINNLTKQPQKLLKRSVTDREVILTSCDGKRIYAEPSRINASPLNVSVNGKKISEHISPIRYRSLDSQQSYQIKDQNSRLKRKSRNINIRNFVYKKYLADCNLNQSSLEYDLNPSLDKLVKLRKMFNEKFRNKSFSDQKYAFDDKTIKEKQISEMIRVTNPDILSVTYSKRMYTEKQKNFGNGRLKYPYSRKNKDLKLRMMYKWREGKGSWKPSENGGNSHLYDRYYQEGSTKLTPWEVFE